MDCRCAHCGGEPKITFQLLNGCPDIRNMWSTRTFSDLFSKRSRSPTIKLFKEPRTHVFPPQWRSLLTFGISCWWSFKLNNDASVFKSRNYVGVGGVIQDAAGTFIGGFSKRVAGSHDVLTAELITIREGLLFALNNGLIIIMVECDAQSTVSLINIKDGHSATSAIIEDIVYLLSCVDSGTCLFVLHNGNKTAYMLASLTFIIANNACWSDDIRPSINSIIMEQSLSSLAYQGSISSAIAEAKKQRKVFVVFISGDDAESSQLESSTWNDSKVAESISKYCVMLHLSQGSNEATQFSAIFPQNSVPCITAVGYNGVQLWQNEGFITAEVLASTLEKLWLSLHIQDTTAAVLSAAFASKTSEPSSSGASTSVSVAERSPNISIRSPSTEEHGDSLGDPTNVRSEKAKEEQTDACTVEDKTCKFGDTPSSKSVEAFDVELSEIEKSDPSVEPVNEVHLPGRVGLDSGAPDLASRAIEGSQSPEQATDSALLNFDGQSQTIETDIAAQGLNCEPVDAKRIAVLSDVVLNIRLPNGVKLLEKFSITCTLKVVKDYVDEHHESAIGAYDLAIPYPRKLFRDQDLGRTLSELGLLDRQALIMVPRQRETDQPISRTVVSSTNESDYGYFSYVKRILSVINPLSYLGGGSSAPSSVQPQHGSREYGSNSISENSFAQAPWPISTPSQSFRVGRGSSSSTTSQSTSRFGSNIHTLKRDEEDGQFKDNNSYWNGNSTQYGGDDNAK